MAVLLKNRGYNCTQSTHNNVNPENRRRGKLWGVIGVRNGLIYVMQLLQCRQKVKRLGGEGERGASANTFKGLKIRHSTATLTLRGHCPTDPQYLQRRIRQATKILILDKFEESLPHCPPRFRPPCLVHYSSESIQILNFRLHCKTF